MELRTYGRSDNCDNYEDPFPDYSPERFPAWMVHAIEKLAEEQLLEAASESSQEVALDRTPDHVTKFTKSVLLVIKQAHSLHVHL